MPEQQVQVPAYPPLSQLLAAVPGKAVEDSPIWVAATSMGDPDANLGSWF